MRATLSARVLLALSPLLLGSSAFAQQMILDTVHYDMADPSGRLEGGVLQLNVTDRASVDFTLEAAATSLTQSLVGGNPANRVDVVFVGDGYTAGELGTYQSHVDSQVAGYFQEQPFAAYINYYEVHRVDVISNESGVDNDPTQGISRDTALNMGYWCGGTERLLCVSVGQAYGFANNAPDVDLVAAIANSSKYGGAGYSSNDLATAAGGNSLATEILIHEFGHALGNLADEYNYGGPSVYNGLEPSARNLSKLNSSQMGSAGTKWAAWLGISNSSFDGLISTYEGGGYSEFGIYRPTNNSCMRNLGRPFNLPSVESILIEVYKIIDPIDGASPTGPVYTGSETLFVDPMDPIGNPLGIQWFNDGNPIPGATGTTLSLATAGIQPGIHTISVTVKDNTAWVRDETARNNWMTSTRQYVVDVCGSGNSSNFCTPVPNSTGSPATLSMLGSASVSTNNFSIISGPVPVDTSIFIYSLDPSSEVPIGNGNLCIGADQLGFFVRGPGLLADPLGFTRWDVDITNPPVPEAQISAGSTWYFQHWYRDNVAGPGQVNWSDGLQVEFCP